MHHHPPLGRHRDQPPTHRLPPGLPPSLQHKSHQCRGTSQAASQPRGAQCLHQLHCSCTPNCNEVMHHQEVLGGGGRLHGATSFTVRILAQMSPLQSTQAWSYLAWQELTSWRQDATSYPGASLLEGASPNSWRYMLTGTDCAGKHNKPRAAEIRLHHQGQGSGSRRCEAPAADNFSCSRTKHIRLQTGTTRGPSTKLKFHPGGTGGPGTPARPFSTAGLEQHIRAARLRAINHH